MKNFSLVARLLLGLLFVLSGSMHFLRSLPPGPLPPGPESQFMTALGTTGYMHVVAGIEVAGGLLLVIGQFLPLGLTMLAPVIVNIALFHLLIEHRGLLGIFVLVALWLIAAWRARTSFYPLLQQRIPKEP